MTAPDFTDTELATLRRFDETPAAPEATTALSNPNDPLAPPMFEEGPDAFPFRNVGLWCDNECDTPDLDADIRANTRAEAFAGLRLHAATLGWKITPALDLCPTCAAAKAQS